MCKRDDVGISSNLIGSLFPVNAQYLCNLAYHIWSLIDVAENRTGLIGEHYKEREEF